MKNQLLIPFYFSFEIDKVPKLHSFLQERPRKNRRQGLGQVFFKKLR